MMTFDPDTHTRSHVLFMFRMFVGNGQSISVTPMIILTVLWNQYEVLFCQKLRLHVKWTKHGETRSAFLASSLSHTALN